MAILEGSQTVSSGELLSEGLVLLLLGMGTVYVFLTLLVFVTSTMSALVMKYTPAKPAKPLPPSAAGVQADDPTLLAVISAAIHAHRAKK